MQLSMFQVSSPLSTVVREHEGILFSALNLCLAEKSATALTATMEKLFSPPRNDVNRF